MTTRIVKLEGEPNVDLSPVISPSEAALWLAYTLNNVDFASFSSLIELMETNGLILQTILDDAEKYANGITSESPMQLELEFVDSQSEKKRQVTVSTTGGEVLKYRKSQKF